MRAAIALFATTLFAAFTPLYADAEAPAKSAAPKLDPELVSRGRYLSIIGGCNDCHTAGFALSEGKTPEAEWLKGDVVGWNGPWGTTYPINLRLYMDKISEEQWLQLVKALHSRPPMPYYELQVMTETDLRAIYQFVRHLGPAGEPAPSYLPPDKKPPQPFIAFPPPPPAEAPKK